MLRFSQFVIKEDEFHLHFVRSSGAGGQNVNKLSTKAVLSWNVKASTSLPYGVKKRFLERWGSRISKTGVITLTSDRHRRRSQNQDEVYARLKDMIKEVLLAPKKRTKTKPTKSSKAKRRKQKTIRSKLKILRKKPES